MTSHHLTDHSNVMLDDSCGPSTTLLPLTSSIVNVNLYDVYVNLC